MNMATGLNRVVDMVAARPLGVCSGDWTGAETRLSRR